MMHLTYLFKFAHILHLIPFANFDKINVKVTIKRKLSSSILIFLLLFVLIIEQYYINFIYLNTEPKATICLTILQYTLLTSLYIYCIYQSLYKIQTWINLIKSIRQLDFIFIYKENNNDNKFLFLITLIIQSALCASIITSTLYTLGFNNELIVYILFFSAKIKINFAYIPLILICFISVSIKRRFYFFNQQLENLFYISRNVHTLNIIERKLKTYKIMNNVIKYFNEIFGWQILLIYAVMLTGQLKYVNNLLCVYSKVSYYTTGLLFPNFLLTCIFLVSLNSIKITKINNQSLISNQFNSRCYYIRCITA